MDVFVVTRCALVDGKRVYTTDVWRIISAAKGSAGYHNACLSLLVHYYRHVMELEVVWVFTDGCRGQYKGRKNFRRLSTFPAEHSAESFEKLPAPLTSVVTTSAPTEGDIARAVEVAMQGASAGATATVSDATVAGCATRGEAAVSGSGPTFAAPAGWGTFPIHTVRVRHLFACGHHFKGSHDGYGKDGKHLPRLAEKQQKVRIADAFQLYHFNATHLPVPRHNVTAAQMVRMLSTLPASHLKRLEAERLPADWCAVLDPRLRGADPVEERLATVSPHLRPRTRVQLPT